jgi:hypothetical protein
MAAGQGPGRMSEHRGLVAGIQRVPGVVIHHHQVVCERKNDSACVTAGPQVFL